MRSLLCQKGQEAQFFCFLWVEVFVLRRDLIQMPEGLGFLIVKNTKKQILYKKIKIIDK